MVFIAACSKRWCGTVWIAAWAMLSSTAFATVRTVPCSGDITSAVSAAIGSSVNGDTVAIGAGSCSMSNLGSINDKNITIRGEGKRVTIITANSGFATIVTNGANHPTWRLSGFTLTSTSSGIIPITVWANQAASWRGPFRVDHIEFDYPQNGACLYLFGPIWGLIDHNEFKGAYESAILTGLELSTETGSSIASLKGAYAASLPYRPGSPDNLYIEDNSFIGTPPNGIAATDTGYTGARIVFRRNTLTNATMYSHWTSSSAINSLWWEVYNNVFTWPISQNMYPFRLHGGGSGLIYNNQISGFQSNYILLGEGRLTTQGQSGPPALFCDGTHDWDGNAGDALAPGWPCLSSTGRGAGKTIAQIRAGDKQPSFPLYLWNNGRQAKCGDASASGPACDNSFGVSTYGAEASSYFRSTPHVTSGFGNGDVDYSITPGKPAGAGTHVLTYTPFVYPYPLDPNGMPNPSGTGPRPPASPSVPVVSP